MRSLLTFSTCLFFFPVLLLAQDSEVATSTEGTNLFALIKQGGWAMWPLGLLMLTLFYLTFLSWTLTARKKFLTDQLLLDLRSPFRQRDFPAVLKIADASDTVLGRLVAISSTKGRKNEPKANREGMEAALIEAAEGEENAISQWINYLNVIATVAPMVGLLGTVSGMISAFQTIGRSGMGKPELLAGNIGEALITTATGLIIGIPAMVAYFFYRNRLTSRMITIGQESGRLFDELEAGDSSPAPNA
jgi:biopolymer transport protein ExbB